VELLDAHNKEAAKEKVAILDSVKDPFIAHRADKTPNKEMSQAWIGFFSCFWIVSLAKQALDHSHEQDI
jgi:hypothetical protein